MRAALVAGLFLWCSAALAADPPAKPDPAKPKPKPTVVKPAELAGAPALAPGKEVALHVWTDPEGVHLRWTAADRPVLFTGSLEADRPAGKIVRTSTHAGGWVDVYAERAVLFSATARGGTGELDGFDLAQPGGNVVLDVQIDGQPALPGQVHLGQNRGHAASLPIRFQAK